MEEQRITSDFPFTKSESHRMEELVGVNRDPWGSSGPTLAVSGPPRAAQWHTEPEGSESSQMEVIRVKYGRWEGRGANPRNERGVEDISPALFLRVSRHICCAS